MARRKKETTEIHPGTVLAVDTARLAQEGKEFSALVQKLLDTPCDSLEWEGWWKAQLELAHKAYKAADEERQELTKPLLDDKRKVDEAYAAVLKPLKSLKVLIQQKLEGRAVQVAKQRQEAQLAAETAAKSGDTEACAEALTKIGEAESDLKPRLGWDIQVVEPDKVPHIYCRPDLDALLEYAERCALTRVEPQVPGVVFTRTAKIVPRGR